MADYVPTCGVLLGQHKGVGPGLFISCQNSRPCPDHPMPHVVGYFCGKKRTVPEGPLKMTPFEDPCGSDKAVWSDGNVTDA
jgi:hypothetical protein